MAAGHDAEDDGNELIRTISKRLFWSLAALLVAITVSVILTLTTKGSGTVFIVMLTGAVGGFVSLQRRLTSLSFADLQLLASSKLFSSLAPFVGTVLALLLYLLFLSGLLTGGLFPAFKADDPDCFHPAGKFSDIFLVHCDGYQSYAKVVIWSFIAGYSEKFVINILGKLEGQAGAEK